MALHNQDRALDLPDDIRALEEGFNLLDPGDRDTFLRWQKSVVSFQRLNNPVYARYAPHLYLPIRAFKDANVTCFPPDSAEAIFISSGSGGQSNRSRHFVYSLDTYRRAVLSHFEAVFGIGPFTFQFCLPENGRLVENSSLSQMARFLVTAFGTSGSGYLTDPSYVAIDAAERSVQSGASVFVFGTAFGLLDLLDERPFSLPDSSIVLETGGMKTYRREITRKDLHARLASGFQVATDQVRSEYGMCELLSQFYSGDDDLFRAPPWVSFCVLDPDDVSRELPDGEPGVLAVFDLANVFSVSAILTEDRAVRRGDGFEILGRLSGAELRGCNFLLETSL